MMNDDGRPLKFASPKELEDKISQYFEEYAKNGKPLTIEGLAVYLDCDRKTIVNYSKREEFFLTIKKAREKISQDFAEKALLGKYRDSIAIFLMKNNFNYEDTRNYSIKEEKVIKGITKDQASEILADDK